MKDFSVHYIFETSTSNVLDKDYNEQALLGTSFNSVIRTTRRSWTKPLSC